ncbi:MAG: hypothetical protein Crog4KO_27220 [Crocinitomicaceae bacterium]
MKKKYHVSIPENCSEDFHQMPLEGMGRSCSRCEQVVRDFRYLSDPEIVYILKTKNDSCGTFFDDQLDRNLSSKDKHLFPTFNIHAVALGLGVLIAAPGYAADGTYGSDNIDLIEVLQGSSTLSIIDENSEPDSLFTFKVVSAYTHEPLKNIKIELIDDRGNVAEVVQTNQQGILVYQKKMLHELRIREIRFVTNPKKFERKTIAWTGTDKVEETIALEPKNNKFRRRRYSRKMRGGKF